MTRPPRTREKPGAVDLADPAARATWLAGLRSHLEDLIGVALDATAAPAKRDFGRRSGRRLIREAASALRHALDAAGAPSVMDADRAVRVRRAPERVGSR